MEIKLEKISDVTYRLLTSNGKYIGFFELDVDGYYYFWNEDYNTGSWSSNSLRIIADKLDEINKPYDDSVKEYFKKESLKTECICGNNKKESGENYCRSCLNTNPFLCN